jgi:hypothetical protein
MKKLISCLLAVVLIVSLSSAAFAYDGKSERVTAFDEQGNDVTEQVTLTLFADRDTLEEGRKATLEEADKSINGSKDLTDLNETLKDRLKYGSIGPGELFDLSAEESVSFPLTIHIKYENMANFVALMHYVDKAWEWVEVERVDDGFVFTAESLSPYLIITTPGYISTYETGEFYSSAENPGAPVVVTEEGEPAVIATPFFEDISLVEKQCKELQDAYNAIVETEDLTELNEMLKAAAGDDEITVGNVFFLGSPAGIDKPIKVVLKDLSLEGYVGLLRYEDGDWAWVEAEIADNELSFVIDEENPYAMFFKVLE